MELSSDSIQFGNFVEHAASQCNQRRRDIQIAPIRSEMDAGKDDLFVTSLDQAPDFGENQIRIHAPAAPTHRGNDAERAVGITAVLNLDDGARTAGGSGMCARLKFLFQKDIAAEYFRSAGRSEVLMESRQGQSTNERFVRISCNVRDTRQVGEIFGCPLRIAAGNNDSRIRTAGTDPSNQLANIAVGLLGNRTGIDDNDAGSIRSRCRNSSRLQKFRPEWLRLPIVRRDSQNSRCGRFCCSFQSYTLGGGGGLAMLTRPAPADR
jgi:hypothetical protein